MAPRTKTTRLRASGFFVARTPTLPIDHLRGFGGGASPSLSNAADEARRLTRILRDLALTPVVREALFVASPSLDDALDPWAAHVDDAGEGDTRRDAVTLALVRYVTRMAWRATPFGLFSGCTMGTLGAQTRLDLASRQEARRHTRLDTHYLWAVAKTLESDAAAWTAARYRPSSSLSAGAEQLRYVEARVDAKTRERSFHLVAAEASDYLVATLARAQPGATARELAQPLVGDDISEDDALAYVHDLIEAQLLESDLTPVVTGAEPLDAMITALGRHPLARILDEARARLRALDASPLGAPPSQYKQVADGLRDLPTKAEPARLFQVDLYKPSSEATLGPSLVREIEAAVATLQSLSSATPHAGLAAFREAFVERYETSEVPLAEALDEERGIGFSDGHTKGQDPSPLLADLVLPERPDAVAMRPGIGTKRRAQLEHLSSRVSAVVRSGGAEWVLSDDDIEKLASEHPRPLPDAFAAFVTVAARDAASIDAGDYRLSVHGVTGPSGANLLGRFCHGDSELRSAVTAHLCDEEALRPGVVYAEIVHLPEGRLGNILCRPVLRKYEIPYLGRSGAPDDCQIPIDDLRVSVRGDRIVLRSARLDREVAPRLSTAHNYGNSELGTYRFLCALQGHDGFAWRWPESAEMLPFLPRIRRGRAVLALARWRLDASELKELDRPTHAERMTAVAALRAARTLPAWIAVADGDNVLPVDLGNVLAVASFVALVKGRKSALVTELFPAIDDAVVTTRGTDDRFAHELIVPFVVAREPERDNASSHAPAPGLARTFSPGSEWLYFKLYGGPATADRVLRDVVAKVRDEAFAQGHADGWFFLRYNDPHPHLRVRFHGDAKRLLAHVATALHDAIEPWRADGRIARVQIDTYAREVERYGGDTGIALAERFFQADSDAALALCAMLEGDAGADARWRLALYGMHRLLMDLGFDGARRRALVAERRRAFANEHGADGATSGRVGKKLRDARIDLEALLARQAPGLEAAYDLFDRRSEAMVPIARELASAEASGELLRSLDDIAASYLHMHVNRMLRSEQRTQEWLLFEFLERLYASEGARHRPQ